MKTKTIHFNKIQAIIASCRTTEHAKNTEVILENFFRMHRDVELFSELHIQLTLKLGKVSDTLYLCEQKVETRTINVIKSMRKLFTLANYKYVAAKL
jgi:hypothetical protein